MEKTTPGHIEGMVAEIHMHVGAITGTVITINVRNGSGGSTIADTEQSSGSAYEYYVRAVYNGTNWVVLYSGTTDD